jgi:outer membrane protein assembly factor BamA
VGLSVESQFDPTKIKKAEVVLKDLGRARPPVCHGQAHLRRIPGTNAVKLIFNIDEGPKVKVGMIHFTGNTAFSDRKIHPLDAQFARNRMRFRWYLFDYMPVLAKTFDRRKLDEDLEVGIRGLYQDNGYFKVVVKDPIHEDGGCESRRNTRAHSAFRWSARSTAKPQTSPFPSRRASNTAWERWSRSQRRSGQGTFTQA